MRGWRCRPRTRGGAPPCQRTYFADGTSSPHTRGCSARSCTVALRSVVVPAHAGVLRLGNNYNGCLWCRPRTRGGAPPRGRGDLGRGWSSPHTRGCSPAPEPEPDAFEVVPAHAGVLRPATNHGKTDLRRPRTRGGAPWAEAEAQANKQSSPHTRGCSHARVIVHGANQVVPAHAGVLPQAASTPRSVRRRPRTRGGAPSAGHCCPRLRRSSPHTRGCWE